MTTLQEKEIVRNLENGNIARTIFKSEKGGKKIVYNLDRYLKMWLGLSSDKIEHIKNNKEQYFTIQN